MSNCCIKCNAWLNSGLAMIGQEHKPDSVECKDRQIERLKSALQIAINELEDIEVNTDRYSANNSVLNKIKTILAS